MCHDKSYKIGYTPGLDLALFSGPVARTFKDDDSRLQFWAKAMVDATQSGVFLQVVPDGTAKSGSHKEVELTIRPPSAQASRVNQSRNQNKKVAPWAQSEEFKKTSRSERLEKGLERVEKGSKGKGKGKGGIASQKPVAAKPAAVKPKKVAAKKVSKAKAAEPEQNAEAKERQLRRLERNRNSSAAAGAAAESSADESDEFGFFGSPMEGPTDDSDQEAESV